ncbi:MAG: hypothetical protein KDA21_01345, partial [Phycisphaerales bacterium]|nr:hypothetical protein [Phycisphaerales bacterium]
MKLMCGLVSMVCFMLLCGVASAAPPDSVEASIREAEAAYADQVYGKAHEIYAALAAREGLDAETSLWVTFREADSGWRALSKSQRDDASQLEAYRKALERLVEDHFSREPDRNRTYAGAVESLGDFWWLRDVGRRTYYWGSAQPWYGRALAYWAASTDLEEARAHYLGIISRVYDAADARGYNWNAAFFDSDTLQNAMDIAVDDRDRARMAYLYATVMQTRGVTWVINQRTLRAYEQAVALGRGTAWYDDALYSYAQYLVSTGRVEVSDEGYVAARPDYIRGLEVFRILVSTFEKGTSQYYDASRNAIDEITRRWATFAVEQVYLPGSHMRFHVNWRNLKQVDVRLYPVDLTVPLQLSNRESCSEWLQKLDLSGAAALQEWTLETGDKGDHHPGSQTVDLEAPLPVGAYVLQGPDGVRELLLVTDLAVVVKSSPTQVLVYACDAITGEPARGATISVELSIREEHDRWRHQQLNGTTDEQGIVMFERDRADVRGVAANVYAAARTGDRQALQTNYKWGGISQTEPWRVYAYADRPAYRPGETAQWRLVARQMKGGRYQNPAGTQVTWVVRSPNGEEVATGEAVLDQFGGASGELALTEEMRLGEYNIRINTDGSHQIGYATLFRLEEYKLPEFMVRLEPPRGDDGALKRTIMGEKVAVDLVAEYYFGGPVAAADVEAIIYQRPFYHSYQPVRDFPWFFEDGGRQWYGWGWKGEELKREKVRTDDEGRATITFETPEYAEQDFEYTVECRVTDASRREITSTQTVRVTRQGYFVYASADHNLRRPGDEVEVTFRALDANSNPVRDRGKVKIERLVWKELWRLPDGTEIDGERMSALRVRGEVSPYWQPFFVGYEVEELDIRDIQTDEEGEAIVTYRVAKEGYYRFTWVSRDPGRGLIQGEAYVWAADEATESVGYHHDGVDLIVDDDTFREGQRAPVMITAPVSGRWVLFAVEAEEILSYRVIHLTGTAALTHVDLTDQHVPNTWFTAYLVSDGAMSRDEAYVVVPPVDHFLDIEVEMDAPSYEPRADGTLHLRVRDHEGKPVSASVSLALVDDSVFAIQSEYASDPRQFFYGQRRGHQVSDSSSFDLRRYGRLTDEDIANERMTRREAGEISLFARDGDDGLQDEGLRSLGVMREEKMMMPASRSGGRMLETETASAPPPLAAMDAAGIGGAVDMPQVQVRSDFRSTIKWLPAVVTDERGMATIDVTFPDNLTRWRATARAITTGTDVGSDTAEVRTRLPLTARLQSPRFFVVGDELTISSLLNNNTEDPMVVDAQLEVEGLELVTEPVFRAVEIEAGGERRVDWLVRVTDASPGEARLRTTVASRSGDGYADAMEKTYPLCEHGIDKFIASSGKTPGGEATIELRLPHERRPGSTSVEVQVTPSLAVTMLDALPYLVRYPYGCTEQTMSRFLPAAITAGTLKEMGLDPEDVAGRIFGGVEPAHTEKTHQGQPALGEMNAAVDAGLKRLADFQHGDGGWGWW